MTPLLDDEVVASAPADVHGPYRLLRVHSAHARLEAGALQRRLYEGRRGFAPSLAARVPERRLITMVLEHDGRQVAVGRVGSIVAGGSSLERMDLVPEHLRYDPHAVEISQLATEVEPHGCVPYVVTAFHLAAQWLRDAFGYERYVAACREDLIGFYGALGAVPSGTLFELPATGEALYIIEGSVDTALENLKAMMAIRVVA